MLKTQCIISGQFETNCYLVYDDKTKDTIIIDPGLDSKKVINKIEYLKLKPVLLINTHGHFDHITADDVVREKYNIPLAIHKNDLPMLLDSHKNSSFIFGSDTIIKKAEILFDKEPGYHDGNGEDGHTAGNHDERTFSVCLEKYPPLVYSLYSYL